MKKASKTIIQKHKEMFYPTVRVRTQKPDVSGTVVYSKDDGGQIYTYVVTNHHVIAECVQVEKKWDPILKKKIDKEIINGVKILAEIFEICIENVLD